MDPRFCHFQYWELDEVKTFWRDSFVKSFYALISEVNWLFVL